MSIPLIVAIVGGAVYWAAKYIPWLDRLGELGAYAFLAAMIALLLK
jgi:hypothetical protein